MIELIVLKPATMNRIQEITGESIAELEVKYMNACERNEFVEYAIQTWNVRKPL